MLPLLTPLVVAFVHCIRIMFNEGVRLDSGVSDVGVPLNP